MMNIVANRASEISTALGGVCCRPSAVRKKARTTTIRVKDVTITTIDGAKGRVGIGLEGITRDIVSGIPVDQHLAIATGRMLEYPFYPVFEARNIIIRPRDKQSGDRES